MAADDGLIPVNNLKKKHWHLIKCLQNQVQYFSCWYENLYQLHFYKTYCTCNFFSFHDCHTFFFYLFLLIQKVFVRQNTGSGSTAMK